MTTLKIITSKSGYKAIIRLAKGGYSSRIYGNEYDRLDDGKAFTKGHRYITEAVEAVQNKLDRLEEKRAQAN